MIPMGPLVCGIGLWVSLFGPVESGAGTPQDSTLARRYYEPNRCGPIALYCICMYFDIEATIDEMSELTGFRGRPVSIAALIRAAEAKGLIAEPFESSLRHLITFTRAQRGAGKR